MMDDKKPENVDAEVIDSVHVPGSGAKQNLTANGFEQVARAKSVDVDAIKESVNRQIVDPNDSIVINGKAHLTYRGVLMLAEKAGLDTEHLKSRLDRVQRATLAWLRLGMAVDLLDHRKAVRAMRDLFFVLGAARCKETTDRVTGDTVLSFGGVGRKARSLRITVHTDMEG